MTRTIEDLDRDVKKLQRWLDYVRAEHADTKRRHQHGELSAADYQRECRENRLCMQLLSRASESLVLVSSLALPGVGGDRPT